MSLEGELEWEPLDPSAVESAEAREYRDRETQRVISESKTRADVPKLGELGHRPQDRSRLEELLLQQQRK